MRRNSKNETLFKGFSKEVNKKLEETLRRLENIIKKQDKKNKENEKVTEI